MVRLTPCRRALTSSSSGPAFLIGFRNRVVVLINWGWNYLTWDRASRVILMEGAEPET